MERVCEEPPIYVIHNFLTESELVHLDQVRSGKESASFGRKSYMMDKGGGRVFSEHRTSTFLSLRKMGDGKIRAIESRAAEYVGLPVDNVEPLQIVRYKNGQHFGLHHDCSEVLQDGSLALPEPGDPVRLVTFFVYLNSLEDDQGGCTSFPELGLRVRPERGAAVLFCNIDAKGNLDPRVKHEAEPTQPGISKFGMNLWISSVSQLAYTQSKSGLRLALLPKPGLKADPSEPEAADNASKSNDKNSNGEKSPRKRKRREPPRGGVCSTSGCWRMTHGPKPILKQLEVRTTICNNMISTVLLRNVRNIAVEPLNNNIKNLVIMKKDIRAS
ncbi:Prolyl 4-hydroxylase subunit alpha-1 [Hondaea fermentalgiana]|uniref:Prolyl 4-hydroxylase subunit alpha-1 n=1 Tax=Hondaea fermentalgiana TaxID=2315210 RepID=A0A2R5GE44_9STRA|nr:Prolyl 4-hydroxylase subunit alpha-1 [Hondaea fermentalgiana]|eukprot:GBG29210.1 Prolyl 4-hydroxylase subunit alpha-1 [Hondaea fermentalgiana]